MTSFPSKTPAKEEKEEEGPSSICKAANEGYGEGEKRAPTMSTTRGGIRQLQPLRPVQCHAKSHLFGRDFSFESRP